MIISHIPMRESPNFVMLLCKFQRYNTVFVKSETKETTMLGIFFKGPRLIMTIVIMLGAIALCNLGLWQWNRHLQREELNRKIEARMSEPVITLDGSDVDPAALDYRQVEPRGVYDPSQEILLRNRSYKEETGFDVITPLRIIGSDKVVLVDRGWIPLSESLPESRKAFHVPGEVQIRGVARASQPYTNGSGPADPPLSAERPRLDAWFRVDIERIQQQIKQPLLPVFVELQPTPGAQPQLPIPSKTESLGLGSHLGYAFQWFSLAAILLIGYVVLTYRQMQERAMSEAV